MSNQKKNSSPSGDFAPVIQELHDAAAAYLDHGWVVVPLEYGSKSKGLPTGHNQRVLDDVDLSAWDSAPRNIMLKLGDKSGGVLDVDLDCSEASRFAELFLSLGLLPETARFGWGPLTHLIYSVPDSKVSRVAFTDPRSDKDMLLELRGNGHGTVIAPSKHEKTGKNLAWVGGKWIPEEIASRDLQDALGLLAVVALFARLWPEKPGMRNESALAFSGCLAKSGRVGVEQAKVLIEEIARFRGDEEAKQRGLAAIKTFEKHEEGYPVSGLGTIRTLHGDEVSNKVSAWLGLNEESNKGGELSRFVMPLEGFLDRDIPPVSYLVKNIVKEGGLVMLFGERGVSKTWFTYLVAKAVADGESLLCYQVPRKGRVLIVDGEMSGAEMQTRLSSLNIRNKSGIRVLCSEILYLEDKPISLFDVRDQSRIEDLFDGLEEDGWKPDLVVIDNLSSMSGGANENDNSEQQPLLNWLVQTRHRGIAVLMVHHAGKNGSQRGASRREDLLDTVISLKSLGDNARPDQGPSFKVEFTKTRGPSPVPLSVEVQMIRDERGYWVPTYEVAKRSVPSWAKMLRCVFEHGPITQSKAAHKLGVSLSQVSKDVKRLRSMGALQAGKQGQPIEFYLGGKEMLKQHYPELEEGLEKAFPDVM